MGRVRTLLHRARGKRTGGISGGMTPLGALKVPISFNANLVDKFDVAPDRLGTNYIFPGGSTTRGARLFPVRERIKWKASLIDVTDLFDLIATTNYPIPDPPDMPALVEENYNKPLPRPPPKKEVLTRKNPDVDLTEKTFTVPGPFGQETFLGTKPEILFEPSSKNRGPPMEFFPKETIIPNPHTHNVVLKEKILEGPEAVTVLPEEEEALFDFEEDLKKRTGEEMDFFIEHGIFPSDYEETARRFSKTGDWANMSNEKRMKIARMRHRKKYQ